MGSIKLSAVIITFNEEKNIERCLLSLREVADEILVVDSYSTDGTKEICEKTGARFIQHEFVNYIEQKNFAASHATYPHVLSLDADEVLSQELRTSILRVKESWDADAYFMNRLTNYCGHWVKHGGWYPDSKIRLWDKRHGQWQGLIIHEKVETQPDSKVKRLKGDILHYSFYSIEQHVAQANKFTTLVAQADYHKGKKVGIAKIIIWPLWKFLRDYFFKAGMLDGYYGFVICIISAHATFIKYLKLRELYRNHETHHP